MTGIIVRAISSFYYVDVDSKIYECKARGIFKHKNQEFAVGDKVDLEVTDEETLKGVIVNKHKRKNFLKRPPIANVTQAILVFSIKSPDPNFSLIDRFLITARSQGIDTVICFNKTDLDDMNTVEEMMINYKDSGSPVFAVCAKSGYNMDEFRLHLKDNISVVAGPSGVGKSTIINRIVEGINLQTGDVSEKIGRGRHTTRHTQLIEIDENSFIADTPGFSSIDVNEIADNQLKEYFQEFYKFDEDCKFGSKCLHLSEPHCAVKDAVEDNEISKHRYESYVQLLNEIREYKKRRNY